MSVVKGVWPAAGPDNFRYRPCFSLPAVAESQANETWLWDELDLEHPSPISEVSYGVQASPFERSILEAASQRPSTQTPGVAKRDCRASLLSSRTMVERRVSQVVRGSHHGDMNDESRTILAASVEIPAGVGSG